MKRFVDRLKLLPWRSLLLISLATVVVFAILDSLLLLGYIYSPVVQQAIALLTAPPLGMVVSFATSVGVGALAVFLLERWAGYVVLNTSILWALVPCLFLGLVLKSLLIQPFLVGAEQTSLIGIVLGVFWKGRPHWR